MAKFFLPESAARMIAGLRRMVGRAGRSASIPTLREPQVEQHGPLVLWAYFPMADAGEGCRLATCWESWDGAWYCRKIRLPE
jgi:hypothetical protein